MIKGAVSALWQSPEPVGSLALGLLAVTSLPIGRYFCGLVGSVGFRD